MYKGSIRTAQ